MRDHARVYRGRRSGHPPWPVFIGFLQVVIGTFAVTHSGTPVAAYLLLLAGPSILFAHSRHPAVAVVGVSAVALAFFAVGPLGPVIPSIVAAVINAVVRGKRIAAWCSLAGLWLGTVAIRYYSEGRLPPVLHLLWGLGAVALLAGLAELVDNRRQRAIAYRKLWEEERRRREEQAQRQAGEERLRMARELHDVLAHSLSLIRVRASVALELMDSNPEEVRQALLAIKQASGSGLDEVRTVLYGLRQPDSAPRAPAADLTRLQELVEQARTAGLTVDLTRSGGEYAVPAAVGLAGYRVIQEALTNVIRHSLARTATVQVHDVGWALLIGIADDGPARAKPADAEQGEGSGLIGIEERAASLGGTTEIGPRPDGGFSVLVALPIPRETT